MQFNYPLYRDGDAKDVDIKFLEKHQIVKGVEDIMRVDLNCDLGEAFGNYSFGGDHQIIPLICKLRMLLVVFTLVMKM